MSEETLQSKVSKRTLTLATIGVLAGAVFSSFLYSSFINPSTSEAVAKTEPQQTILIEDYSTSSDSELEEVPTEGSVEVIATIEVSSGSSAKPSTSQNVTNGSSQVTVTPNPKPNTGTPAQTPNSGPTSGSNNQQPVTYCPDTREENPSVYDACRAGFVAPAKFEWARYHSCERLSDTKVKLVGLVRMVGGSYSEVTYGSPTVDGLILVSSVQEAGGPFITWNIQASFWSMDSRYHGRIATAGGSGQVLIQTSELDPSCRL